MNLTIFWLIVLVALVIIELSTMALTTIWFAGGAAIAAIAASIGAPVFLQIILFLAVSGLLLFFTRPLAVKYFNKDRIKTNAESLVGREAIVTEEIDNLKGTGQVTISGQEWTARAAGETNSIPQGAIVYILAINGVKLIVEERKEER